MVRIEAKPPVITKNKAVYEWQIVCNDAFSSFSGVNSVTTISGARPVDRLAGQLPTVVTMFIEVETVPHGDGTMLVKITNGHRDPETRPLLTPSAKPSPGGYGYGSSGYDGFKEAPANSFVVPIATSSTVVTIPSSTDLALISLPGQNYSDVTATKYGPDGKVESVYRTTAPLDTKGDPPIDLFDTPKFRALMAKGYQIEASHGRKPSRETFTLKFKP